MQIFLFVYNFELYLLETDLSTANDESYNRSSCLVDSQIKTNREKMSETFL